MEPIAVVWLVLTFSEEADSKDGLRRVLMEESAQWQNGPKKGWMLMFSTARAAKRKAL